MHSKQFGLLPATIYRGSKSARASGGGNSFSADTFVKVGTTLILRTHKFSILVCDTRAFVDPLQP